MNVKDDKYDLDKENCTLNKNHWWRYTYVIQFNQKPILRWYNHLNFAAKIQTMRKWQQPCLNVLSADKTYVASDSFYVWAYTDSVVFVSWRYPSFLYNSMIL